jgi:uncharacterized protein YacL (UPF0231 family)
MEPDYIRAGNAPKDNLETLPTKQQIKILQIQKPEDVKTISDIKVWIDDNEVCVSAKINDVELPFWWAGASLVGHLMYGNTIPGAKKQIFEWLQEKIQTAYEEDENFSNVVDKFKQNQQIKSNVGPEVASKFNDIIDNIL